jgi:antitoxin VapB
MSATAKVFKHGRSQAVRLPKEFRFEGSEVRVTKVGDRVILEPLESSAAMPWAIIDGTGDSPFMPEGRDQPAVPKDRVVFER